MPPCCVLYFKRDQIGRYPRAEKKGPEAANLLRIIVAIPHLQPYLDDKKAPDADLFIFEAFLAHYSKEALKQ